MIIAAENKEIQEIMLRAIPDAIPSEDRHLGNSWETAMPLPEIAGYKWSYALMFGVKRALLESAPPTEAQMLEILSTLEWAKSSIYNVPAADFPLDFRILHRLPFVKKAMRGYITLKAVWDAPDGNTYAFRQEMAGTQGYCKVYLES